jgi:hypothetical protein
MLNIWRTLRERTFEVPVTNKKQQDETEMRSVTLSKKDFYSMLSSMFKLMIHGITGDILRTKLTMEEENHPRFEIYRKLSQEMYDDTEYRLSLWLPLTLKEKIDMIMHQRIEDELEIMLYLLEQEYDLMGNIGNSDKMDLLMERSLDGLIFEKYKQCTRFQAIKKSLGLCDKRLNEVVEEDKSLLEYAAFLREKKEEYQSTVT